MDFWDIMVLFYKKKILTFTYQKLQRTSGGVKNLLQHPRNEEFVKHHFHVSQVFHMQDAIGQLFDGHINKIKMFVY